MIQLPELNLPKYDVKIVNDAGRIKIFDFVRKKYLVFSPEEWVRQNFVQHLIHQHGCPASLIAIEMGLKYNQMSRRADIVVYGKTGEPLLIVECKSTEVKITQETFEQIARYNHTLKVPYLVVTNGIKQYCAKVNIEKGDFQFLKEMPDYEDFT